MYAAQELVVERPASDGQAVELGLPGTFAARGVRVPFTTPALAGARVRLTGPGGTRATGAGLELLLPNPSGKGGIYVIEWGKIPRICCPTLFDRDLIKRIAVLPALTPNSVRGATCRAGATGLAGEAVSEAASHAAAAEQQGRLAAHVALLMALIRQGEEHYGAEPTPAATAGGGAGSTLEGLERRARRAIAGFAADLALPDGSSEALGQTMEHLAALFGGIGLGPRADEAWLARIQRALEALSHDAEQAAAGGCDAAGLVARASAALAQAGRGVLRTARARAENVAGLLRGWSHDATAVADELTRAEWVFDGCDRLLASQGGRLSEAEWRGLAAELPIFPDEAAAWSPELGAMAADMRRLQRRAAQAENWRTGLSPADLVAANETFLANALRLESVPEPAGAPGLAA